MFLSSLIEELCTKEENNKAGCALTFGEQCISILENEMKLARVIHMYKKHVDY